MIKLTSPFLNLPYLVLFYCASFYFSNLWNTFIEHFHSPLPLEFEPRTLAKESLLDGVMVTDRPWAPCFNGIEGSLVIWFDRGFHRFNTDQRSVPSLLRVPRVWNRGLPRQGSCNRGHPTLPVDVPRVVIV